MSLVKEVKTAIVTGAAHGIGLAIARYMLMQGRQVMLVDKDEDELKKIIKQLHERNLPAQCCYCDIANEDSVALMVAHTVSHFDGVDILVNNAAITFSAPVESTCIDQWNQVLMVNLAGAYSCTQQSLKYLSRANGAAIVNISSIQGLFGQASTSAYSAAKGGLIAMTKSMAVEFGQLNIRVNAIAPGFIETNMSYSNETEKYEHEEERFKELYIKHGKLPLGRTGYPIDIAGPAHFLTSSQSAYITGHVLVVDGGVTSTY